MTADQQADKITRFVGYVLIRRLSPNGYELHVERIYDTEPDGPIVGDTFSSELSLGNDDTVVGVIPAANLRRSINEQYPGPALSDREPS